MDDPQMAASLGTKWWGWGRSSKTYYLPSATAFWDFLSQKLGPLGTSPHMDSLDRVPLPPPRLTHHEIDSLRRIVGEGNASVHAADRAVHSLGKSYLDLIRIRHGEIPRPTDVVVYPETEAQIESLLRLSRERDWIIIPFGGGTSVVGGVEAPAGSRPAITLDLKHLNKVLAVDTESRLATVECGIFGPELEGELNGRGYTLGHFPQSFEFSTLGGWIATRSAGQQSTKYGKIEDMVCSLRVLTPTGAIETPRVPAAAAGSDLLQMLIGSEGLLGVITRATVKLHPLPRYRTFSSFLFHSFEQGASAARELLQMGLQPALLRLSDEDETKLGAMMEGLTVGAKSRIGRWWIEKKGFPIPGSILLTLGFEAAAEKSALALLRASARVAKAVTKQNGGLYIGESAGKRWHQRQFELPYLRDLLLDHAVMVDTLETATTWQNLTVLHRAVKQALSQAIEADGEKALVLTHLSHAYPEGASLYYTFMARQKPGQEQTQWQRVKNAATETILGRGGALSHHHGVGTMHKAWMPQYVGKIGTRLVSSLKTVVDPESIMNPSAAVETERGPAPGQQVSGTFSYRTRSANICRFSNEKFDLAIIGGGITGAGIARDAAMRGMKVALLEKSDFAGGTSSKSSGMIHGGLRYLKQLDIKMVKESLHEREILLHLAPHLIRPKPYLIPSYRGHWEKLELQIGMIGYNLLAHSKSVPSYQKLSAQEVIDREPLLKPAGLGGGFVYYDCLVNDARLTLATLKSAAEHGALLANYVNCVGFQMRDRTIEGIHFEDLLGDIRGTLSAKVVINATGSWTDVIRRLSGEEKEMLRPTKGIHLVVRRDKLNVHQVVVVFTSDERMIFVVPFGSFTYVGTTDTDYSGPPDAVRAEGEDISYLLRIVNETFDCVQLTEEDVVSVWSGLRPLLKEKGRPSSLARDCKIAVDDNGLVSIAGGKLTIYRSMAEGLLDEILDRFGDRLGRDFSECQTAKMPLYGGDIADFEQYVASELKGLGDRWGLSPDMVERLVHHYGTDYLKILSLGLIDGELLRPLSSETIVLKAEVIYAVEDEMAMCLEDFMARRTELKHFDLSRGTGVAKEVARLMGMRLQWDEAEKERQLGAYRAAVAKMMEFRGGRVSVTGPTA